MIFLDIPKFFSWNEGFFASENPRVFFPQNAGNGYAFKELQGAAFFLQMQDIQNIGSSRDIQFGFICFS